METIFDCVIRTMGGNEIVIDKTELIEKIIILKKDVSQLLSLFVMKEVGKKGLSMKRKIDNSELTALARSAGGFWFDSIRYELIVAKVRDSIISWYDSLFKKLLEDSIFLSHKADEFGADLFKAAIGIEREIIPHLYMIPTIRHPIPILDELLSEVKGDEKEFINEAVVCLSSGSLRAPVIMGWSAAIHRLHIVIEGIGFQKFSSTTTEMKKKKKGRFGRYNKEFTVSSLNEFKASVFDTDVLWVLEYWNLITKDEHDRLKHCYTLRCNAAHPGGASITIENMQSFFSDLALIVFRNPKFSVET